MPVITSVTSEETVPPGRAIWRAHSGARCRFDATVGFKAQLARIDRYFRLRQNQRTPDDYFVGVEPQRVNVQAIVVLSMQKRRMIDGKHQRLAGDAYSKSLVARVIEKFHTIGYFTNLHVV